MSIPYIPGWGDTLKSTLPQLGENLHKIIKPHAEAEQRLKRILEEDPEKINSFIDTAQTNPGVLSNIFGEKAEQFIAQQTYTPQELKRRKVEDLNITNAEGIIADRQEAARRRAEADGIFQQMISRPGATPEFIQWATAAKHGLPDVTEYENKVIQRKINDIQLESLQYDASLRDYFNSPEVQSLFNDPKKPMTVDKLMGLMNGNTKLTEAIFANPALGKYWMDQINNLQAERSQMRLFTQQFRLQDQREAASIVRQEAKEKERSTAEIARLSNLRDRIAFNIMSGKVDPENVSALESQLNDYQSQIVALGGLPTVWRIRPENKPWFGRNTPAGLEALDPITGMPISGQDFMRQQAATGVGIPESFTSDPTGAVRDWMSSTPEDRERFTAENPNIALWIEETSKQLNIQPDTSASVPKSNPAPTNNSPAMLRTPETGLGNRAFNSGVLPELPQRVAPTYSTATPSSSTSTPASTSISTSIPNSVPNTSTFTPKSSSAFGDNPQISRADNMPGLTRAQEISRASEGIIEKLLENLVDMVSGDVTKYEKGSSLKKLEGRAKVVRDTVRAIDPSMLTRERLRAIYPAVTDSLLNHILDIKRR